MWIYAAQADVASFVESSCGDYCSAELFSDRFQQLINCSIVTDSDGKRRGLDCEEMKAAMGELREKNEQASDAAAAAAEGPSDEVVASEAPKQAVEQTARSLETSERLMDLPSIRAMFSVAPDGNQTGRELEVPAMAIRTLVLNLESKLFDCAFHGTAPTLLSPDNYDGGSGNLKGPPFSGEPGLSWVKGSKSVTPSITLNMVGHVSCAPA
eukprot:9501690-Pyramimonas_sp.AAC.1